MSGQRFERDALYALAEEMRQAPPEDWPDALVLLGDQIYADEPSAGTMDFIRSRRDPEHPPGVADFEEYTQPLLETPGATPSCGGSSRRSPPP